MKIISKYKVILLFIFVFFLSLNVDLFIYHNNQQLLYGDSLSRLNISRKIVDNLTPGFAQVGNVWLPLPQILMLTMTWNSYLWHTGLAGTIMSGAAFIIGGWFIYKTIKILSDSSGASIFGLLVYALNVNLLYLQTTAMSESLFICLCAVTTYGLVGWATTRRHSYLMFAALSTSALTLTRYEGLAILGSSIVIVTASSYLAFRNKAKAEGDTILFATLACLGFVLWTIYLAAIFGNPLYWKTYYADVQIPTGSVTTIERLNYIQAAWKYFTSVVWMSGLISVLMASAGILFVVYKTVRGKTLRFLPLLLPFAVILFMILTLHGNTTIDQPDLNIKNLLSNRTSFIPEFNIRYGILILPWIAIFCGYLFSIRNIFLRLVLVALLLFQVQSYFTNQTSLIYQLRLSVSTNNTQGTERDKRLLEGLKRNYDGGLIMISALKHDPQMFQMGIDYKNYIHEGAGIYWKTSIKNPSKYAKFVVLDRNNQEDQVTKFLKNSKQLSSKYSLIFEYQGMDIYKLK